jgi:cysteine synthase
VQYTDINNAASYEHTLGPELASQIEQLGVNGFTLVAAASTGGALMGVARYLRRRFASRMTVKYGWK